MLRCFVVTCALLLSASALSASDWPCFRGPGRDGKSSDNKVPLEWGKEKNVRWRAILPQPGNSSPIVSNGRVFVTCAQDKKGMERSVYCFDRQSGKQLWVQTVRWERADPTYPENPYCASTPAADDERVVVWHGSAGLFCYDHEGKQLWTTDLGMFKHIWGYASSPIIHNDRVYLDCGPGARSFVVCLDKTTGKVLWQTDEPGGAPDKDAQHPEWLGSWGSPVIATVGGREELLVYQPGQVKAYAPDTGEILWTCGGAGLLAYTDVVLGDVEGVGQVAVAMGGYGGKAIGFKPGGMGDITGTRRLWQSTARPPQRIGSGVILENHLFIVNEPGVECIDPATGKTLWNKRLTGENIWSSLISTPGRLYASTHKGRTYVFAPDAKEFRLLATNDLGERINSTPAVSDGQLFIRTWKALYCIGE
jgi:outer membrane protein assembly factor BamB